MAVARNTDIKQQSNFLKITKAEKVKSWMNLLPSMSVTSNGYRTDGRQFSNEKGEMVNNSINVFSYNFSSDITLFNGLQNFYRLRQSYQLDLAQEKKVERTIQDVIFQASKCFLQILLDKELVDIAEKDFEVQKKLYNQIKMQVDIGNRVQIDLLTQDAQFKSSEVQLMKLKNLLNTDKINFSKILVIDTGLKFEIIPPSWNNDTTVFQNYRLDSLLNLAKKNRPDMAILKAEEKAALMNVRISKTYSWPRLSANYFYNSFYESDYQRFSPLDSSFHNIPFREQLVKENYSNRYGLSLYIPIFGRLNNRVNVVRSKVNYENTQLALNDFERQLDLDVNREYQNFIFYKESFVTKKMLAEASLRAYEKESELYRMGKSDIITLSLQNQKNLIAQSEKVQAQYTLHFQKIILDYYTGTLKN